MLTRRCVVVRPSANSCDDVCPETNTFSCQAPADGAVSVPDQRHPVLAGSASSTVGSSESAAPPDCATGCAPEATAAVVICCLSRPCWPVKAASPALSVQF